MLNEIADKNENNKYQPNRYTFLVNHNQLAQTEAVTAEFIFSKITSRLDILSDKTTKAANFNIEKQQYNLDAATKLSTASMLIKKVLTDKNLSLSAEAAPGLSA
ncbi:MAG: hypothetical protein ACHP65_03915 [Legionellales bacterium]